MNLENLKYPIGKFSFPEKFGKPELDLAIENIEKFPERLRSAVNNLTDEQLDTQYRPNGWTVRQTVNHCADSHINSLVRFKLTLTQDKPTINTYREDKWAELADSKDFPIEASLKILEGLHKRWSTLLKSMTDEQYDRVFIHPEFNSEMSLKKATAMYSWHCNHHLAHIVNLADRQNWNR